LRLVTCHVLSLVTVLQARTLVISDRAVAVMDLYPMSALRGLFKRGWKRCTWYSTRF